MPEGDTLARIAAALRPILVDKRIEAARGRPGDADLARVVGHMVTGVTAKGKHLLIDFDNGLTLHTHLGLHGSWHRYRRGDMFRRSPSRTVAVLETDEWVAACFDAPTVQLMDTRAVAIHPGIRDLGTDLASDEFDADAAVSGLRDPGRRALAVGDALLDQGALAGLGNVYRSELCFIERVNPFTPVAEVSDDKLRAMAVRGATLVKENSRGGARVTTTAGTPSNTYVYGRTGRPCFRCRTAIRSATTRARETSNPRRVYWCPSCQGAPSQSRNAQK